MTIPHALLALLAEEPKFGLRLKEEFEHQTGSIWPLNVGQVYSTLQRLERDGLVVNSEDPAASPSQKLYTLTEPGRAELETWLSKPPDDLSPPRDEIVIKVMVAVTLADVDVLAVIQDHRRHAIESMQSLTRLKASGDDGALLLVLDSLLFRIEATVRWLDTAEARFRNGDLAVANRSTSSLPSVDDQATKSEAGKR